MAKGATRESLRRHNLSAVLSRVHRAGPQSRSSLTALTGLNRSTIGALVAELVDLGLVEEAQPEATGVAGRPSPLVRPTCDFVLVAAIDIGSKWQTVAFGGLGGEIVHTEHREADNDARSYEDTLDEIGEMFEQAQDAMTADQRVIGVGVAAPGVVRAHDGFVHVAPNIGWHECPLGADLAAMLGDGIQVTVANEAHLGARAEHLRGAGIGVDDMIYLSSEIGVGGGAIIGGELHLGADGYSGEIGHIPVHTGPDAVSCRCGSVGCLEAETGALALLRLAGVDHTEHLQAAVSGVIEAAHSGDEDALRALEEIGHRLGRGLAGIINLLNPRRLVLGGYFAEGLPYLLPGLTPELDDHALAPNLAGATVVAADLRGSSALLGALEVALEPLLADPAQTPVPANQVS